ncbi:MAG: DUF86 domain-containing protein [Vulcanimicrobiota bacterium]
MVDRRTVEAMLTDLNHAISLLRVESQRPLTDFLDDEVRAFGIQHLLQISIESLANISNHLAADLGWRKPKSYVESFTNLVDNGVVKDSHLGERLVLMARFRNLVVHRYWKVDTKEVHRIICNHLDDLSRVAADILRFLS